MGGRGGGQNAPTPPLAEPPSAAEWESPGRGWEGTARHGKCPVSRQDLGDNGAQALGQERSWQSRCSGRAGEELSLVWRHMGALGMDWLAG